MRRLTQRTEAVINLSLLEENVKNIRNRLGKDVEIMAVLKGDGYGHGEKGLYPTLKKCGVESYAVAVWEEGASLRNVGATEPILLLGDTCDGQLDRLVTYNLTPTIFSLSTAEKLNDIASRSGIVQPINIKIDTGMSRIGFPADDSSVSIIKRVSEMKNLEITGAFTHFSRADEPDGKSATAQLKLYLDMISKLEQEGIKIPQKHIANSPAILLRPETQLDAVRAGDILYGLSPLDDNDAWYKENLRQILSWYTYVAMVKDVPAGTEVGYGGTFVTTRKTKIATIPIGFADGYSRDLSNKGKVMINGKDAPIIGRVCMDQFMVDITDIPDVAAENEVTLVGCDGELVLTMEEVSEMAHSFNYELPCRISRRVPRVYTHNGEVVKTVNYF